MRYVGRLPTLALATTIALATTTVAGVDAATVVEAHPLALLLASVAAAAAITAPASPFGRWS